MNVIETTLALLGKKATDRITGFSGVVTSVCFDLYGCVQVILSPGVDKDGKARDSHWLDVKRLDVAKGKPVMDAPDFSRRQPGDEDGPENKAVSHI